MKSNSLGRNTTYFTFALIIQKILSFIYFWFVSNALLPNKLGQYIFALSFTSLFSIFIDLGMNAILIRESSKNNAKANDYLKNIISLKIPLALITLIGVFFFISISNKPPEVKILVYLASIIMFLDAFTVSFWAMFRSIQNMLYESTSVIIVQIIIFGLGITVISITKNTVYLMSVLVAASMANFIYAWSLIKIKLGYSLWPAWNKDIIKHFLKLMPAFALGGIFAKIYLSADSVLLGYLADDQAVGFYAIPAKVVTALAQIIPAAFAASIFPVFSRYFIESTEKLKNTFVKSFSYLLIISLPITGGMAVLLPNILNKLWPKYAAVQNTFIIMSMAIPFVFLSFATGYLLNACDRQKNNTINRGIMAGLTVILNIILIPNYSYLGSGITFFVVNFAVFILDMYWVKKIIPISVTDFSSRLIKILAACIIMMFLAFILIQYIPFLPVIILCGLIYFAILFLTKTINLKEIKKQITI